MNRLAPVLLALLLPLAALAELPIARSEFRDQHGNVDALARYEGAPVVAVVVAVRRLSLIEQWERDLAGRVPGIRFLNVADLPRDVPVDLERTAAMLRKRVPAGVNVLMDPGGAWATAFELDTAAPNLLVFTGDGRLAARFRGRWNAALAGDVAAAVRAAGGTP